MQELATTYPTAYNYVGVEIFGPLAVAASAAPYAASHHTRARRRTRPSSPTPPMALRRTLRPFHTYHSRPRIPCLPFETSLSIFAQANAWRDAQGLRNLHHVAANAAVSCPWSVVTGAHLSVTKVTFLNSI